MTWKIGLVTLLLGVALTLGGCISVGTAVSTAVAEREVANVALQPGATQLSAEVDPAQQARLRIEATLAVAETVRASAASETRIVPFELPVNYEVNDGEVHRGAGSLGATEIIPAIEQGEPDRYDGEVTLVHDSARFRPPPDGKLAIEVTLPDRADDGSAVVNARLHIIDQVGDPARWALGGAAAIFVGPLLAGLGFLIWIVGLVIRPKRRAA